MTIDNIKGASHFRINLDLIFYSAPCSGSLYNIYIQYTYINKYKFKYIYFDDII